MTGVTLRAGSSAVAFAVVAAVAVLLVGDAVLRGSWPVVARSVGPAALVVWIAWLLLVRPSIRVRPDRAVVVNVGRITEVPWTRIADIRRRLQLVLDLDDGRSIQCWGSPFPRRRLVGKGATTEDDDPAGTVLRSAWLSGSARSGAGAAIVRRFDILALSLGAGSLVAAALSVTLGGAR